MFFPKGTISRVRSGSRWVWSHKKSPVTVFPIFPLGFRFVRAGVFGGDFLRVAQIFAGTRGDNLLPNPLKKQRRCGSDCICCHVSLVS